MVRFTLIFKIIVNPKITYPYCFIIIFFFFILTKIPYLFNHFVFNCFIFFFLSKSISYLLLRWGIICFLLCFFQSKKIPTSVIMLPFIFLSFSSLVVNDTKFKKICKKNQKLFEYRKNYYKMIKKGLIIVIRNYFNLENLDLF